MILASRTKLWLLGLSGAQSPQSFSLKFVLLDGVRMRGAGECLDVGAAAAGSSDLLSHGDLMSGKCPHWWRVLALWCAAEPFGTEALQVLVWDRESPASPSSVTEVKAFIHILSQAVGSQTMGYSRVGKFRSAALCF